MMILGRPGRFGSVIGSLSEANIGAAVAKGLASTKHPPPQLDLQIVQSGGLLVISLKTHDNFLLNVMVTFC